MTTIRCPFCKRVVMLQSDAHTVKVSHEVPQCRDFALAVREMMPNRTTTVEFLDVETGKPPPN